MGIGVNGITHNYKQSPSLTSSCCIKLQISGKYCTMVVLHYNNHYSITPQTVHTQNTTCTCVHNYFFATKLLQFDINLPAQNKGIPRTNMYQYIATKILLCVFYFELIPLVYFTKKGLTKSLYVPGRTAQNFSASFKASAYECITKNRGVAKQHHAHMVHLCCVLFQEVVQVANDQLTCLTLNNVLDLYNAITAKRSWCIWYMYM